MSLKGKVVTAIVATFGAYIITDYVLQQTLILPQFLSLEQTKVQEDVTRCREAVQRELQHLAVITNDWSVWDDTYNFVSGRYPQYVEMNCQDLAFQNAKLNLMFMIRPDGTVAFGKILDFKAAQRLHLDEFPETAWPKDHPMLGRADEDDAVGTIVNTRRGPMLVASRAIVHNDGKGPSAGTVVFGRFLDREAVEHLNEQTRVKFDVWPVDAADGPAQARALLGQGHSREEIASEPQDEKTLAACALVQDSAGRPVLLLKALIPRDISVQGRRVVRFAVCSLGVAGVGTIAVLIVLLGHIVIGPLNALTRHAVRIGVSKDLQCCLFKDRQDEIGTLCAEFDRMVQSLAEARVRLTESSRLAGMADVASGVLHNVGNVLNSLTVSAGVVTDAVRQSKVTGLQKAVGLVQQHQNDLERFMTEDERGRKLPEYLVRIAETLTAEQQHVLSELDRLHTHIGQVNEIVQAQQRFTSQVGHEEPTSIERLIHDSMGAVRDSFLRHRIEADISVHDIPSILVDRIKLMQIVVNLLSNAKDATKIVESGTKRVSVRVQIEQPDHVVLSVTDTGVGITQENLARIFESGFTTKPRGHGYGLHYSALAAKELGGSLACHSDGPGTGATFTLTLPLRTLETFASCPRKQSSEG
jgi:sensor domain CHASE-containing protein